MNLNKNILCVIAAILTILFLTVMDSRGQFGFNNVAVVGSFTANVASTGGGGGGAFDPSTVTGYSLDYDVDILGLSDGTEITNLDDKGASDFDLIGADGPYWTNNVSVINGKAAAYFDGATAYLQTNFSTTFSQTNIYFVVASVGSSPASALQFFFDSGTAGDARNAVYVNSRVVNHFAGVGYTEADAAYVDNRFYLWEFHFAGSNSRMLTNGVAYASGNAGTDGQHGITLGSRYGGDPGSYGFKGNIARVILFNSPITAGNLTSLRTYFQTNYNLW